MIKATAIPILQDNYAWLLRDEESGCTAIVVGSPGTELEFAL